MSTRSRRRLLALVVVVAACGGEPTEFAGLYERCTLTPSSTDQARTQCARGDDVSCAVFDLHSCDDAYCARYQGSAAFCTAECSTDTECGAGRCVEFTLGAERTYCVSDSPPTE